MTTYKPNSIWHKEIHEIGTIEPVAAEVANLPHRQIADNLLNIAVRIKALENFVPEVPEVPEAPTNPAGTWTVTKRTIEPQPQGTARQFDIQHSSNEKSTYNVTYWQRKGAAGTVTDKKVLPIGETNATGYALVSCPLAYSLSVYDQVVFEVSAGNTPTKTEAYPTTLPPPPPPPPAVWTITALDSEPFAIGSTPSFTITNTGYAGNSVSWYVDDVTESMFEGDTVRPINSGSGTLSASGSLTIRSGAIPSPAAGGGYGHKVAVRVVSITNARRTFTAAK